MSFFPGLCPLGGMEALLDWATLGKAFLSGHLFPLYKTKELHEMLSEAVLAP